MPLSLVTAPAQPILTKGEARDHLRLDGEDDIALVDRLVAAVTAYLDGREGYLGRALVTQTWDLTLDRFPLSGDRAIAVPLPPLQSVTSITYLDGDGVSQIWASSNYTVDTAAEPGVIRLAYAKSWPLTRRIANAVTVRFVAGYGDHWHDVPEDIRHAALLLLGHWYEHREEVVLNRTPTALPMAAASLLALHRVAGFGMRTETAA